MGKCEIKNGEEYYYLPYKSKRRRYYEVINSELIANEKSSAKLEKPVNVDLYEDSINPVKGRLSSEVEYQKRANLKALEELKASIDEIKECQK
eukprot:CAMPEP_0202965132 /NCGR_PEP_ID=MMETSP1396-20130829/9216_1 /ASSEMBLY_ACC=CAM_ASM_000872 /TAXON_ID= /ORGANISM="Pseudokeronopsis sp., Strain Brazil" /LENGTH=92 /DNA_ID=CAMNT_0049687759 /DNA_START=241 /DNA_END=522 /DNA_ORIENTATION=+